MLREEAQNAILFGSAGTAIEMAYDDGLRAYKTGKSFEGIIPNMQRRWKETDSAWVREELGRYQNNRPCETCCGQRLKPEALAVKIRMRTISEVAALSIAEAAGWYGELAAHLTPKHAEIAERILKEINERLGFLVNVGLDYLTSRAHPARCLAARASASGWPPRSARA